MQIVTDDEIVVVNELTNWALSNAVTLSGFEVRRTTLDDVYLSLDERPGLRGTRGARVSMPRVTGTARERPASSWRLVAHQVRYEQLAFWLNRVGAVFTVGFSVLFLVMMGASAGQSRVSYLGNMKLVEYYVPAFVAYGVMSACFTTLAITMVVRREKGLLKRLRLSPLPTGVLVTAILVSTAVVSLVEVASLVSPQ